MDALILALLTAGVLINWDRESLTVELFLIATVALIRIGMVLN
jgi:hypothetical protein